MKVKTISRSVQEHSRSRASDNHVMRRNITTTHNPFQRAREYVRAVNAAKIDRMFAKPFVAALDGHVDGVYCLAKHPWDLNAVISGSADGEIRIWDLASQQSVWTAQQAHQGMVRGTCAIPKSRRFLSVGNDRLVKVWHPEQEMTDSAAHRSSDNAGKGKQSRLSFAERARLAALEAQEDNDSNDESGDERLLGDSDREAEEKEMNDEDQALYQYGSQQGFLGKTRGLVRNWDGTQTGIERHRLGAVQPVATFQGEDSFSAVDHHRNQSVFATSSSVISIWDINRSQPIKTMEWGADTINTVKFNQTEVDILASCGTDRTIILYDLRTQSPLTKVVTSLKTNAISWNPMEAFTFAAANEDHNVYLFDMRNLSRSTRIMKGHVSAVLDVDYSPTGEELVTGSYDRTIRIFSKNDHLSRDMYHGRRMQRVFCVKYTMDDNFILSGSDDGNVRIWKARASQKLGPIRNKEKSKQEYNEKLRNRYKHLPEVRRVLNNRSVPSSVSKALNKKLTMLKSEKRREENRKIYAKNPDGEHKSEYKKSIIQVTHK
ncbi:Protein sof1 [Dispira parvispora]|uniref:DDB1- and CUL4-associated factor 13 n=1 Tax=Dispira parvispora TaxID=1520584 RepID=A0A9W8ASR2_9FUNG|nr:Protein sof1 [Dispira parvispora]